MLCVLPCRHYVRVGHAHSEPARRRDAGRQWLSLAAVHQWRRLHERFAGRFVLALAWRGACLVAMLSPCRYPVAWALGG